MTSPSNQSEVTGVPVMPQHQFKPMAVADRPSTGVFVLGMHRSGTSALTRILNLMGANLGEQLLGAKPGNASGHWESIPVIEINERVLAALGMSWSDPRTMSPSWLEHDEVVRLLPEARVVVAKEFLQAKLWAVKDPRLSRLLNFWKSALAAENSLRLTSVVALRHPFEVASSLLRRDDIPLSVGMLLWYLHTSDALRSSRGMPRVVVDYSDLIKDWKHEVSRIDSVLDLGLRQIQPSLEVQVNDFLDSSLWHERSDSDEQVPAKIMALYRVLKASKSEGCIVEAESLVDSLDAYAALHDSAIRDIHVHRERLRQRVMALEIESSDSPGSRDAKALEALEKRLEPITSHIVHADWVNAQLEERCRKADQDVQLLRTANEQLLADFEWVQRQLQRMVRTGFGVNELDAPGLSIHGQKISALLGSVAQHVAEGNWVGNELERLNKESQSAMATAVNRNRALEHELEIARIENSSREDLHRSAIDEQQVRIAALTEQLDRLRATWYRRIRARLRGSRND